MDRLNRFLGIQALLTSVRHAFMVSGSEFMWLLRIFYTSIQAAIEQNMTTAVGYDNKLKVNYNLSERPSVAMVMFYKKLHRRLMPNVFF